MEPGTSPLLCAPPDEIPVVDVPAVASALCSSAEECVQSILRWKEGRKEEGMASWSSGGSPVAAPLGSTRAPFSERRRQWRQQKDTAREGRSRHSRLRHGHEEMDKDTGLVSDGRSDATGGRDAAVVRGEERLARRGREGRSNAIGDPRAFLPEEQSSSESGTSSTRAERLTYEVGTDGGTQNNTASQDREAGRLRLTSVRKDLS